MRSIDPVFLRPSLFCNTWGCESNGQVHWQLWKRREGMKLFQNVSHFEINAQFSFVHKRPTLSTLINDDESGISSCSTHSRWWRSWQAGNATAADANICMELFIQLIAVILLNGRVMIFKRVKWTLTATVFSAWKPSDCQSGHEGWYTRWICEGRRPGVLDSPHRISDLSK